MGGINGFKVFKIFTLLRKKTKIAIKLVLWRIHYLYAKEDITSKLEEKKNNKFKNSK